MFYGASALQPADWRGGTSQQGHRACIHMFWNAASFNPAHRRLECVVGHTTMPGMFYGTPFNQPIGDWDVSAVTGMGAMFTEAASFNQPIGDWDVSAVNAFDYMFERASTFNQDPGKWSISSQASVDGMLTWADCPLFTNRKKDPCNFLIQSELDL